MIDVLLGSARVQLAELRSSRFLFVLGVVQPAVFTAVALLPQDNPGPVEGARVASAVLLSSLWGATVWTAAGILRRERAQGTLAAILTSVADARLVALSKSLTATAVSAVVITATVAATFAGLRQPVAVRQAGWVLLGLLLVLASGTAAGMLVSCLFVLTRFGPQLSSALMYPVLLIGGLLIPVQYLPSWTSWLSWLVSLRWIQEFLVDVASGSLPAGPAVLAGLDTLLYAVLAVHAFGRVVDAARQRGSLDLV